MDLYNQEILDQALKSHEFLQIKLMLWMEEKDVWRRELPTLNLVPNIFPGTSLCNS